MTAYVHTFQTRAVQQSSLEWGEHAGGAREVSNTSDVSPPWDTSPCTQCASRITLAMPSCAHPFTAYVGLILLKIKIKKQRDSGGVPWFVNHERLQNRTQRLLGQRYSFKTGFLQQLAQKQSRGILMLLEVLVPIPKLYEILRSFDSSIKYNLY